MGCEPTLEIPLMGGEFVARADVTLGVVGAACQVSVDGSAGPSNTRIVLVSGQKLTLMPPTNGVRVYVAAPGGFVCELVLGSCAGQEIARGWLGQFVDADRAPLGLRLGSGAQSEVNPESLERRPLRFVAGPQADLFDLTAISHKSLYVQLNSDRRGLRLSNSGQAHNVELPSEAMCVGTVQLTPDGTPIVIGPDGPTIGGYPKIGVIIEADLDRLGQLRPDDKVVFQEVSIETARALRRHQVAREHGMAQGLEL